MERASVHGAPPPRPGRPNTKPYRDANGGIALPHGTSMSQLLDQNIEKFGDELAYRYVDYSHNADGTPLELTR
jgi:hypothetical protein